MAAPRYNFATTEDISTISQQFFFLIFNVFGKKLLLEAVFSPAIHSHHQAWKYKDDTQSPFHVAQGELPC